MTEFGFIGTGNMGGALAKGVCMAVDPSSVTLSNRTRSKAEKLAGELGCKVGSTVEAASKNFVFIGVKPGMVEDVIDEIRDMISEDTVIVSMAAAVSIGKIEGFMGKKCGIVRIMPNTPVSVGSGVIAYARNEAVSDAKLSELLKALSGSGKCSEIPEKLFDAETALAGCGPAFVQLFIEALADGGVACGLTRAQATEFAAMTVMGSAKMVLDTGKNPAQLKDEVCSPGGSTIQGVRALEANGFRAAAIEAVVAAYEKSVNMGK